MSVSILILCLLGAPSPAPEALGVVTPRVAVLEVTGPTRGGELSCGAGWSRLEIELARGERRRVRIPFSHVEPDSELVPAAVDWEAGTAKFVEWELQASEEEWTRLPAGLRNRPIPQAAGVRQRPSPAGWLLLTAGIVTVRLFRKRTVLALCFGLGTGASILTLPVSESVGSVSVAVLEGDVRSGKWVKVLVQPIRSSVEPADWLRVGVVPGDARLSWVVDATSDQQPVWRAEPLAPSAGRLILCERFSPPDREAAEAHPDLTITEIWWRAAAGGPLVATGPWPLGTSLTPIRAGLGAVPSWLAAGLPPGVGVLFGRLEPEEGTETWVRLVGF